jgi:hypothetical protein
MRRSQDGYISATGMFKATFPWAELSEEEAERKYIKSLPTTSTNDTAGNVWIPPTHALELAEEYGITAWIKALLDNEPIEVNPAKDSSPKFISSPPKFLIPQEALAPPTPARSQRARRSASPSKIASPRKAIATPRKPKTPKASSVDSHASAANKSLHDSLKEAADNGDTDESLLNGDTKEEPKVRVNVETDVEVNGDIETTHTHVEVEMPAGSPELPLPEDTEGMIAKAKEMVEAAVKAEAAAGSSKKKLKRKADVVDDTTGEEEEVVTEAGPVVKKVKVESDLRKEKVKTRALIGISATLAIGYVFLS